jgi:hypothetical protein
MPVSTRAAHRRGNSRSSLLTRTFCRLCALTLLPLLAAACGSNNTTTTPTSTTVQTTVNETFADSFTKNGAKVFAFVANTGSISAAMTTLSASDGSTPVVGMQIGEWNATTQSCQLRITNDAAVQGTVLVGSAQASSGYCVRVNDNSNGALSATVSFLVTITHY